jgi:hypothetical protein
MSIGFVRDVPWSALFYRRFLSELKEGGEEGSKTFLLARAMASLEKGDGSTILEE